MANFTPNPKNTVPATQFSTLCVRTDRCTNSPNNPEKNAIPPNTNNVANINNAPRINVCNATDPRAGDVNCGKNARKNNDTLGFVKFITTPRRNNNTPDCLGGVSPVAALPLARNAPHAKYSKYAAPSNFSTVNADCDAANTAASPTATASV